MIDALIAGKIYGTPQQRTGKSGSVFVTEKARCASGDGEGVFVNVIAFDADTCHSLMALVQCAESSLDNRVTHGNRVFCHRFSVNNRSSTDYPITKNS